MTRRNASPQAPGPIPPVSEVPVEITGPMGRGYLMLPCKHQRAAFPDPYHHTAPQARKCRTCGLRYSITFRLGSEPDGSSTALIMRLS